MALSLYFLRQTPNGELEYACIRRELHLVDGLAANMLIKTNIISPEGIIINLREKTAYVLSCAITLEIDAKLRGFFICRKLLAQYNFIVRPYSKALISFTFSGLPDDRDFLFEPSPLQGRITLFSHFIDHHTSSILVRNDSSKVAQILRNYQLGAVKEMFYKNCFQA